MGGDDNQTSVDGIEHMFYFQILATGSGAHNEVNMARKKRDRMVGMTRFHDEQTDQELVNTMSVEVTPKRARTVVGSAVDAKRQEPVTSHHPAVIGYQLSVSALMRKMARQNRPVTSYWVPKSSGNAQPLPPRSVRSAMARARSWSGRTRMPGWRPVRPAWALVGENVCARSATE